MNDITEMFSNARLRFVKATVVSNLFPMYPHLGQMEMNFAAKINGRFEIGRYTLVPIADLNRLKAESKE